MKRIGQSAHPKERSSARHRRKPLKALLRTALACAILALAAPVVNAQEVRPVALLDSATILIGQQARLELSVTYRVDQGPVRIGWPMVTDTLTAKIPVLHDSHVDTILPDKANDPYLFKQVRTLTITAWEAGYWPIPPFTFTINGDTLGTDALLFTVNTVEVDTTQAIRDIKEIYEVPFSLVDWLHEHWKWIAGGLAAMALLTGLFLLLYRRSRRPPAPAPAPAPVPAHTIALQALDELEKKRLWQQDRSKAYYTELTDILRAYVEGRYGVPAMEQTTDELLGALGLSSMPGTGREQLGQILRLADMVKFAKWKALPSEHEQAMAGAIKLVQETATSDPHAPLT